MFEPGKGLLVVHLDEETKAKLKELAIHPKVHCHHITLAYRPSQEVYDRYARWLDKSVHFTIVEIVTDELGQAVVVKGIETENPIAHITISCAEGTPPVYSNTLLCDVYNSESQSIRKALNIKGGGRVGYVPF